MPIPHLNLAGSASAIGNFLFNLFEKKPEVFQEVLKQQTAKFFETLDDEAIMTGLIPAVRINYMTIVQKVMVMKETPSVEAATKACDNLSSFINALEPHQKRRLRRILAKLTLTEKYEDYVSKVITDKKGEATKHYDRRLVDYEYTAEDHRVIYLALLAYDLQRPEIGEEGVKAQLFAWGTILESTVFDSVASSIGEYGDTVRKWLANTGIPKTERGIQHALGMMLDPQTFQEFLDRYPHDTEEEWEKVMELFLNNQRVRTGDMQAENERLRRENTWTAAFAGGPLWALVISAAIFLICFGIWFANH